MAPLARLASWRRRDRPGSHAARSIRRQLGSSGFGLRDRRTDAQRERVSGAFGIGRSANLRAVERGPAWRNDEAAPGGGSAPLRAGEPAGREEEETDPSAFDIQ